MASCHRRAALPGSRPGRYAPRSSARQNFLPAAKTEFTERTIHNSSKCRTLEFLGGNLGSMASFIDEAITRLPTDGAIQGADFAVLAGILTILSSPERMREISETISSSSVAAVEPLFVKPDSESDAETEDEAIDEDSQPVLETAGQTPKPVNLNTTEAWSW
jgi:hypothetical protein